MAPNHFLVSIPLDRLSPEFLQTLAVREDGHDFDDAAQEVLYPPATPDVPRIEASAGVMPLNNARDDILSICSDEYDFDDCPKTPGASLFHPSRESDGEEDHRPSSPSHRRHESKSRVGSLFDPTDGEENHRPSSPPPRRHESKSTSTRRRPAEHCDKLPKPLAASLFDEGEPLKDRDPSQSPQSSWWLVSATPPAAVHDVSPEEKLPAAPPPPKCRRSSYGPSCTSISTEAAAGLPSLPPPKRKLPLGLESHKPSANKTCLEPAAVEDGARDSSPLVSLQPTASRFAHGSSKRHDSKQSAEAATRRPTNCRARQRHDSKQSAERRPALEDCRQRHDSRLPSHHADNYIRRHHELRLEEETVLDNVSRRHEWSSTYEVLSMPVLDNCNEPARAAEWRYTCTAQPVVAERAAGTSKTSQRARLITKLFGEDSDTSVGHAEKRVTNQPDAPARSREQLIRDIYARRARVWSPPFEVRHRLPTRTVRPITPPTRDPTRRSGSTKPRSVVATRQVQPDLLMCLTGPTLSKRLCFLNVHAATKRFAAASGNIFYDGDGDVRSDMVRFAVNNTESPPVIVCYQQENLLADLKDVCHTNVLEHETCAKCWFNTRATVRAEYVLKKRNGQMAPTCRTHAWSEPADKELRFYRPNILALGMDDKYIICSSWYWSTREWAKISLKKHNIRRKFGNMDDALARLACAARLEENPNNPLAVVQLLKKICTSFETPPPSRRSTTPNHLEGTLPGRPQKWASRTSCR